MTDGEVQAGLASTANYRYTEQVGDHLFVAGQVPHDPAADLVGVGDPVAQARQCIENLRTLLAHHGFGLGDTRKLTVYVVGPHDHLVQAWEAIVSWFGGEVPPATLLGVNQLGYRDQLVEIDATVMRSSSASSLTSPTIDAQPNH